MVKLIGHKGEFHNMTQWAEKLGMCSKTLSTKLKSGLTLGEIIQQVEEANEEKDNSLCWGCKNAVPTKDGKYGCCWSRHFKPVKGWEVETQKDILGYTVLQCPKFIID
jgi:hypothetical protein